jgi:predicted transcriptional regulator
MLTEIMNEFRKTAGPISLSGLSQRLGIEQNALEGMLETLARQGKIREVGDKQTACAGCSSYSGCPYAKNVKQEKVFIKEQTAE